MKSKTTDVSSLLAAVHKDDEKKINEEEKEDEKSSEHHRLERINSYKEERRKQLASLAAKYGDSSEESDKVKVDVMPSLFHAAAEGSSMSRSRSLREGSPFKSSPSTSSRSQSFRGQGQGLENEKSPEKDLSQSSDAMSLTDKFSKFREQFGEVKDPIIMKTFSSQKEEPKPRVPQSSDSVTQQVSKDSTAKDKPSGQKEASSTTGKQSGHTVKDVKKEPIEHKMSKTVEPVEETSHQKRRRQLPTIPMALGGSTEPVMKTKTEPITQIKSSDSKTEEQVGKAVGSKVVRKPWQSVKSTALEKQAGESAQRPVVKVKSQAEKEAEKVKAVEPKTVSSVLEKKAESKSLSKNQTDQTAGIKDLKKTKAVLDKSTTEQPKSLSTGGGEGAKYQRTNKPNMSEMLGSAKTKDQKLEPGKQKPSVVGDTTDKKSDAGKSKSDLLKSKFSEGGAPPMALFVSNPKPKQSVEPTTSSAKATPKPKDSATKSHTGKAAISTHKPTSKQTAAPLGSKSVDSVNVRKVSDNVEPRRVSQQSEVKPCKEPSPVPITPVTSKVFTQKEPMSKKIVSEQVPVSKKVSEPVTPKVLPHKEPSPVPITPVTSKVFETQKATFTKVQPQVLDEDLSPTLTKPATVKRSASVPIKTQSSVSSATLESSPKSDVQKSDSSSKSSIGLESMVLVRVPSSQITKPVTVRRRTSEKSKVGPRTLQQETSPVLHMPVSQTKMDPTQQTSLEAAQRPQMSPVIKSPLSPEIVSPTSPTSVSIVSTKSTVSKVDGSASTGTSTGASPGEDAVKPMSRLAQKVEQNKLARAEAALKAVIQDSPAPDSKYSDKKVQDKKVRIIVIIHTIC